MSVEDDMTKWRTAFCADPTRFNVTTYPNTGTEHTVVQSDKTKLRCTITPDSTTAMKVVNAAPADLKVLNTPDGETVQPVSQGAAIQGIWPAPGSVRIKQSHYVVGVARTVIYTVPGDKRLFISNSQLASGESADADSLIRLQVETGASEFRYYLQIQYYMIAGQQVSGEHHLPALEAAPTWQVVIEGYHANIKGRGKFEGWLEDA